MQFSCCIIMQRGWASKRGSLGEFKGVLAVSFNSQVSQLAQLRELVVLALAR